MKTAIQNFRNRCNEIYVAICPWGDKDYLDSSDIDKNGWVVRGKNHDFIARFKHEPTDKEIHNAICDANGLHHKRID
ncbi:MAG: hypothetical protein NC324_02555 [Bacteroides sp.]|nr:hypothetical protein [Bacteroides sp.]